MKIGHNGFSDTYFIHNGYGSQTRYLNHSLEWEGYPASDRCRYLTFKEAETAIRNREHLDKLGENRI
jgi:hypothetical protein